MYKRLLAVFVALFVTDGAFADIASTTFYTGINGISINSSTGQVSADDTIARKTDIVTTPDATDSVKGQMKLYTSTGQNTDGTITQKAISDALNAKVANNATGTGSIALGTGAAAAIANAIQLGAGTNATANSFQVGSYPMLNLSDGKIPNERLQNTGKIPSGSASSTTLVQIWLE